MLVLMKQWRRRSFSMLALAALLMSLLPAMASACAVSARVGTDAAVCQRPSSINAASQSEGQNTPCAPLADARAVTMPRAACAMPNCCRVLPTPVGDHQPPTSAALVFSSAAAKSLLSAFAGLEPAGGSGSHALLAMSFVIAPPAALWQERAANSASPLSSSHSPPSSGRSPPSL